MKAGLGTTPVPVGDGDQLRAVVRAQAPGLAVGHLVLSQPVAGRAVPLPTLARESGRRGVSVGRALLSHPSILGQGDAIGGTTERVVGLSTVQRGLV